MNNPPFRVIVAGSRTFDDYELLKTKLDKILKNKTNIVIVSGTCRGTDRLGERYGEEKGYHVDRYPAKWDDLDVPGAVIKINKFGKKYNILSGNFRNKLMSENADALVAFWNGKIPSGTYDMIQIAKDKGLSVRVIQF